MNKPFKLDTLRVKWRHDPAEWEAWTKGRTGYPIVDAGMRQLNETGWMHNRVRMIVASFLTKHLLHNWQEGERYFMQHLIDGDLGKHVFFCLILQITYGSNIISVE
jgi:deoxyribodipyrimidine photo-lyase